MTWLAVILGIALTAFGATAGAALITVSRAELTRAVGRRLIDVGNIGQSKRERERFNII